MDMHAEAALPARLPSGGRRRVPRVVQIWLERFILAALAGSVAGVILLYKVAIMDFREAKVDLAEEAQIFQGVQGETITQVERIASTTIVLHLSNGSHLWVASHRSNPVVVGREE